MKYSQKKIHEVMSVKGFWNKPINIPGKLCLIHSEVSEALETFRRKIFDKDDFSSELADIVIRVMDLAEYLDINLEEAIDNKMEYNETREHKHGKRF